MLSRDSLVRLCFSNFEVRFVTFKVCGRALRLRLAPAVSLFSSELELIGSQRSLSLYDALSAPHPRLVCALWAVLLHTRACFSIVILSTSYIHNCNGGFFRIVMSCCSSTCEQVFDLGTMGHSWGGERALVVSHIQHSAIDFCVWGVSIIRR